MRRRMSPNARAPKLLAEDEDDVWEAWILSANGEKMTALLTADEDSNSSHLLATSCGPLVRIGERSMAVGLGNLVKVITVGHERFDSKENNNLEYGFPTAGRRRKATGPKKSCGLNG